MQANIKKQLKVIEKSEALLARKKKALMEQEKQQKAIDSKLESLVKQSGFKTPKELVEALVLKYGIRLSATRTASGKMRRRRTKITAQLRDEIRKQVKDGKSMNAVSKEKSISYAVVAKICNGAYDHLK